MRAEKLIEILELARRYEPGSDVEAGNDEIWITGPPRFAQLNHEDQLTLAPLPVYDSGGSYWTVFV